MDDHVWAHIDTLGRPHQMKEKSLDARGDTLVRQFLDNFFSSNSKRPKLERELKELLHRSGEPVNAQATMQEEKRDVDASNKRPQRHGSPVFYSLLDEMAETHDKKSHDYATDSDPIGNYHFAGFVANMFSHSSDDAGFAGRLAEKMYRLSVLGKRGTAPKNESIDDTERDIAVIATLWMSSRREMRQKAVHKANSIQGVDEQQEEAAALDPSDEAALAIIKEEPKLSINQLKEMAAYLNECYYQRKREFDRSPKASPGSDRTSK